MNLFSHIAWGTLLAVPSLVLSDIPKALPADPPKALPVRKAMIPQALPDPLEPLNRGVWQVNKLVLEKAILPSSRVYREAVPQPVRRAVGNVASQVAFPGRLLNNMLQGRWDGAGRETERFLVNTFLGVGGLRDVATERGLPATQVSFSGTFAHWGWKTGSFVVLPFLGPSDTRNALGLALDKASEPWNYFWPYSLGSSASTFDQLANRTEEAWRVYQTEADSYDYARHLWTYATKAAPPKAFPLAEMHLPSLETIAGTQRQCEDPLFPSRGKDLRVSLVAAKAPLTATYWLQPGPAPVVYLVPGYATHRLSAVNLRLAEMLYQRGCSVVSTTSIYHPESICQNHASPVPGCLPQDLQELLRNLSNIDQELASKFGKRLGNRIYCGCSMGGYLGMGLAAAESKASTAKIRFHRYLAVHAPVDLNHAEATLDSYFRVADKWPEEQRLARLNNTLHKAVVNLAAGNDKAKQQLLDGEESRYLVGLSFRFALRDMIWASQSRYDLGVLQTPVSNLRRTARYEEILQYSFSQYREAFLAPYAQHSGVAMQEVVRLRNMRSLEASLKRPQTQQRLHIIANANDFLLAPSDLKWLRSTFPKANLTVFPNGGHQGNLTTLAVVDAIATVAKGE